SSLRSAPLHPREYAGEELCDDRAHERHADPPEQELPEEAGGGVTVRDGGDAQRAERGEGRNVDERRADVDAERDGDGVPTAELLDDSGRGRQESGQYHAGGAAEDGDCPGDEGDDAIHRRRGSESGEQGSEEVEAAGRLEDADEEADAGDHEDGSPRHPGDRAALFDRAERDEENRRRERAEPEVHLEE